jgi:hypothetical protein
MATPNQPGNPSGEPPWGWQPHGYGRQQNPQIPPPQGYPGQPGYPPQPGYPQPQPYPGYPSYPGYPGNVVDPQAPFGRDPATGAPLSDKSGTTAGLLQLFLGVFGIGRFYIDTTQIAIAQLCWVSSDSSSACSAFSAFRSWSVPASGPSSTRS